MRRFVATLALMICPALAGEARGSDFDYFILALSWSPTWCALEGERSGAGQCDPRHDHGFTLHGLWPQYETGWPSDCYTAERDPARAQTRAMADIMGSSGLAWHEWRKHGRCSGLAAADYFALSRRAYDSVVLPDPFDPLRRDIRLPALVIEDAFIEANRGLDRNMVTVTCESGRIAEVRICLSLDLTPRPCGEDAIRDCKLRDALMESVP